MQGVTLLYMYRLTVPYRYTLCRVESQREAAPSRTSTGNETLRTVRSDSPQQQGARGKRLCVGEGTPSLECTILGRKEIPTRFSMGVTDTSDTR